MKQLITFLLSIFFLMLCSGCAGEQTASETAPSQIEESIPCTEVQAMVHDHTFGLWEYGDAQMQRFCEECGALELRDMTDEEQFRHLLQGHWEPYEATLIGVTKLVYYLRTGFWYVYADYDGGDTLTYASALFKDVLADFTKTLTIEYSHFDPQSNSHHAVATSADGLCYQIILDTSTAEPLLYLTPEPNTDVFDRIVFSRYEQVAPVIAGTWSCIHEGKILHISLNPDQTFSSNIDDLGSGTWQLAPGGSKSDVGGIQLFYNQGGKPKSLISSLFVYPSTNSDAEDDQNNMTLSIYFPVQPLNFKKALPEQLQPVLEAGSSLIAGTWESKSRRSYGGEDTTRHILTDYTLTAKEDGTFTLMTDQQVNGSWIANGVQTINGRLCYQYLFTYPNSSASGETVTLYADSNDLTFAYKVGKTTTYLSFVQYNEDQWADFLAGPDLLPGSYVSQKIVRYDEVGDTTEEAETDYTLTINEDGTVTGNLHQSVTGIWFYDDLLPEEGHRYIFRMDHTPPEQASERKDDGTLVFDTKIDGEHIVIYFYPESVS